MATYTTAFASLDRYDKGGVEVINDDPKNYVFSNMFDVASAAALGEGGGGQEHGVRARGRAGRGHLEWRAAPTTSSRWWSTARWWSSCSTRPSRRSTRAQGSVAVAGEPAGTPMGRITAGRGHMALLPAGRCYRFHAERPGVILLQTIEGPDTVYRWADICQTA